MNIKIQLYSEMPINAVFNGLLDNSGQNQKLTVYDS